jgi:hypothetical protein
MRTIAPVRRQIAALAWLVLLLTGCAHASIRSTTEPDVSKPMHRLVVFLDHTQVNRFDSGFTPYLVAALERDFMQSGVEVVVRQYGPRDWEDRAALEEILRFRPDGVLVIANDGVVISYPDDMGGSAGGVQQIYYDVSLFELTGGTKKQIWRAQMQTSGGIAHREERMNLVAKRILERLHEYNVISHEPRHNTDGPSPDKI